MSGDRDIRRNQASFVFRAYSPEGVLPPEADVTLASVTLSDADVLGMIEIMDKCQHIERETAQDPPLKWEASQQDGRANFMAMGGEDPLALSTHADVSLEIMRLAEYRANESIMMAPETLTPAEEIEDKVFASLPSTRSLIGTRGVTWEVEVDSSLVETPWLTRAMLLRTLVWIGTEEVRSEAFEKLVREDPKMAVALLEPDACLLGRPGEPPAIELTREALEELVANPDKEIRTTAIMAADRIKDKDRKGRNQVPTQGMTRGPKGKGCKRS